MAVFRIEKTQNYTVMSNHHLRNKDLTLKAKGLLSQMLSLPEEWDFTLAGLAAINKESVDAIRTAVLELERAGYIKRIQGRDAKGKMVAIEYVIFEQPRPAQELSYPVLDFPTSDNPTQLSKEESSKDSSMCLKGEESIHDRLIAHQSMVVPSKKAGVPRIEDHHRDAVDERRMVMPRLTEEQLDAAKEIDLLSFLSAQRPGELVRTATNEYRTTTHSSLVIRADYWYWNKGGVGSRSAVNYLVSVERMGFIDAAREVNTEHYKSDFEYDLTVFREAGHGRSIQGNRGKLGGQARRDDRRGVRAGGIHHRRRADDAAQSGSFTKARERGKPIVAAAFPRVFYLSTFSIDLILYTNSGLLAYSIALSQSGLVRSLIFFASALISGGASSRKYPLLRFLS
jgi:hypothetical protein